MNALPRRRRFTPDIDTSDFDALGPRLDRAARGFYGAGASLCLRRHRPRGQINLRCVCDGKDEQLLVGVQQITQSVRSTFADLEEATEHGAYGIALLATARHFQLKYSERSYKGTGFDFFMLPPGADDDDPNDLFGEAWGLEASGILDGGDVEIRRRMKQKRKQVERAKRIRPVIVAIVEFSEPAAILERQR